MNPDEAPAAGAPPAAGDPEVPQTSPEVLQQMRDEANSRTMTEEEFRELREEEHDEALYAEEHAEELDEIEANNYAIMQRGSVFAPSSRDHLEAALAEPRVQSASTSPEDAAPGGSQARDRPSPIAQEPRGRYRRNLGARIANRVSSLALSLPLMRHPPSLDIVRGFGRRVPEAKTTVIKKPINWDEKYPLDPSNPTLRYNTIMSTVEKLLDAHPGWLGLFGGIVRDCILPSILEGSDPFSFAEERKTSIRDIDLYLMTPGRPGSPIATSFKESRSAFLVTFRSTILRNLDLILLEEGDGNDYFELLGCTTRIYIVRHRITRVVFKIDLSFLSEGEFNSDFDVSQYGFSKVKGLHQLGAPQPLGVSEMLCQTKVLMKTCRDIAEGQCRMGNALRCRSLNEQVRQAIVARVIKFLRQGWRINDLSQKIVPSFSRNSPSTTQKQCTICHREMGDYLTLTCSQCHLCLDCFEVLLQKRSDYSFSCPTCREVIVPWETRKVPRV